MVWSFPFSQLLTHVRDKSCGGRQCHNYFDFGVTIVICHKV
jgi:hypothetical protein